jgi:alginate O-acetyltransferase complex protein AlgI
MLFNSLEFLLFFPVVTLLFFALRHKYRWLLLLAASCFFYMFFKPVYILILAFTIVVDYLAGLGIERTENLRKKKFFLIISICGNVLVLAIFKYFNFINENVSVMLNWAGVSNPVPYLNILLPIGLSFHTFQAMSYIIEIYRGNQKAERHFGYYSLYVMFYPQLVAGPIERPQNLLHQFHEPRRFDMDSFTLGIKMMIYGFFKKVVIADNIAALVNNVYANHYDNGWACLIAMFLFSIQIYCDFSGYSHIALGTAKCMGIDLMRNFALPYGSDSLTEFWRRWHISLSTWFRDYVYIPLGGSSGGKAKGYFNLMVVFLISGLWHGANWNYIIWGGLHAVILILERLFLLKLYKKLPRLLPVVLTFLVVTFTWVIFRIEDFARMKQVMTSLTTLAESGTAGLVSTFYLIGNLRFIVLLILVTFFLASDRHFEKDLYEGTATPSFIRRLQYQLLVVTILVFGSVGEIQFIYFQF